MALASRRANPRNQNNCQGDADRRRDEIVDREPCHLDEVAHRGFRHIRLPVRVSDEAHRGVERQHLVHPGLPLRVERQVPLQALQHVECDEAGDAEEHHRQRIGAPGLVLGFVDAATPVDEAFDRSQQRTQRCPLAGEHAGHVAAERPRDQDDDYAKQRDLQPSVAGHQASYSRSRLSPRVHRNKLVRSPILRTPQNNGPPTAIIASATT